jgi:hypothetical protein
LSLYRVDKSIMFEDVVSETYIYCVENSIEEISEQIIIEVLKKLHKEKKYNYHSQIIDSVDSKTDEEENMTHNLDDLFNNLYALDKCKSIGLTNEEISCLLYMQDKRNIKNYDFSFVKKTNENSIDKNKLSSFYEKIIQKLLNELRIEILN